MLLAQIIQIVVEDVSHKLPGKLDPFLISFFFGGN
jgi:hypothetical protein